MQNNNGKDKKVTFSKILLIVTGAIFVSVGIFVGYMYGSGKIANAYDTTAIVTLITVTGTIFASNLCWYSKKSASENHYKLRMSLYKESADVRYEFNEKMAKLIKDNDLTQCDIDEIESKSDCDEFMCDALTNTVTELDTLRDISESENQIEQV